jgi:hypothetical protein
MAHSNQHRIPNGVGSNGVLKESVLPLVVEVCWLQFKPGHITEAPSYQDGSTMMHFLDIGAEIERESECEWLSWGSDEGSFDTLVMLICKSAKLINLP